MKELSSSQLIVSMGYPEADARRVGEYRGEGWKGVKQTQEPSSQLGGGAMERKRGGGMEEVRLEKRGSIKGGGREEVESGGG